MNERDTTDNIIIITYVHNNKHKRNGHGLDNTQFPPTYFTTLYNDLYLQLLGNKCTISKVVEKQKEV